MPSVLLRPPWPDVPPLMTLLLWPASLWLAVAHKLHVGVGHGVGRLSGMMTCRHSSCGGSHGCPERGPISISYESMAVRRL
eukprot:scaffold18435_cov113-Isochrysis_galbana.AAC.8